MRIATLLLAGSLAIGCGAEEATETPTPPTPPAAPTAPPDPTPARAANVGGDGVPFELRASVVTVESGAVEEEVVQRVMRRHINDLRRCYAASRAHDEELEGSLRLRWTVAPTGAITDSVAEEAPSDEVGRCAAGASEVWRFPNDAMGEEPVTIRATVRLHAAE